MSFSSRRRNYLLTPHRRDGLIEWMKAMLQHSFVLDALDTTGADTFTHFEVLIEEHRRVETTQGSHSGPMNAAMMNASSSSFMNTNPLQYQPSSRLRQLVPTIGVFHTPLPLRAAFRIYNQKHKLTKRKHIQISFNEIRHILNLAQIMALRKIIPEEAEDSESVLNSNAKVSPVVTAQGQKSSEGADSGNDEDDDNGSGDVEDVDEAMPTGPFNGPCLISFDGDQTLYSDGANFESNPLLASYLYQLLRHGVTLAVVTAAGYEYRADKYEFRLSGLLEYFQRRGLNEEECSRFYLFGGECNYLFQLGQDFRLHPVKERGPGGWHTATQYLTDTPGNWSEAQIQCLLDVAETSFSHTVKELNLRAKVIRKRRSVGLIPDQGQLVPRESLDEAVLRAHEVLREMNDGIGPRLPYCAFNGGSDAWVDVGNKRVGVQILQSYLGIAPVETLHIGDQFLNTGNDYAARDVSPCVWIISPQETTYILKSILRLASVKVALTEQEARAVMEKNDITQRPSMIDFQEMERREKAAKKMDVYTGEIIQYGV